MASDIKGVLLNEFDHEGEKAKSEFQELLTSEFQRCEHEFETQLGTHSVLSLDSDNLVQYDWRFDEGRTKDQRNDRSRIELTSRAPVDLVVRRQISPTSLLVVEFELAKPDSRLTAYVRVHFGTKQSAQAVWFGYATAQPRAHLHSRERETNTELVEITIPFDASAPGNFILMDNLFQMIVQRVSSRDLGPLVVDMVRFRGQDDSLAIVNRVFLT